MPSDLERADLRQWFEDGSGPAVYRLVESWGKEAHEFFLENVSEMVDEGKNEIDSTVEVFFHTRDRYVPVKTERQERRSSALRLADFDLNLDRLERTNREAMARFEDLEVPA